MGIFDWFKVKVLKVKTLEELINGLSTEGGRAEAVFRLINPLGRKEERAQIPPDLVEQAIAFYEKEEKPVLRHRAVYLAEQAGVSTQRQIEIWKRVGDYGMAAILAAEAGQEELASTLFNQAIANHEEKGELYSAAVVAEAANLDERAKSLYERALEQDENAGEFFSAARIARQLGHHDRAKKLYEQSIEECERRGDFYDAAEAAKYAGQLEQAEVYQTLGNLIKAFQ